MISFLKQSSYTCKNKYQSPVHIVRINKIKKRETLRTLSALTFCQPGVYFLTQGVRAPQPPASHHPRRNQGEETMGSLEGVLLFFFSCWEKTPSFWSWRKYLQYRIDNRKGQSVYYILTLKYHIKNKSLHLNKPNCIVSLIVLCKEQIWTSKLFQCDNFPRRFFLLKTESIVS